MTECLPGLAPVCDRQVQVIGKHFPWPYTYMLHAWGDAMVETRSVTMQFKDKLGNCLIQTITYLSLNWSSQLSVICGGQHVPLEARDTCEKIGVPSTPLDS